MSSRNKAGGLVSISCLGGLDLLPKEGRRARLRGVDLPAKDERTAAEYAARTRLVATTTPLLEATALLVVVRIRPGVVAVTDELGRIEVIAAGRCFEERMTRLCLSIRG